MDLFFVLSGFLITTLLVDEAATNGVIRVRAFCMRRILRLLPALGVVAAATVLAYALLADHSLRDDTLGPGLWTTLLYVSSWWAAADHGLGGFGHTWSLSIEEHFYALWPIVVAVAIRRQAMAALVWCAFGIAAMARLAGTLAGWDEATLHYRPDMHAHKILAGAAVASAIGAFDVVATTCVAFPLVIAAGYSWLASRVPDAGVIPLVLGPLTAIVIAHIWLHPDAAIYQLLSQPLLRWIGQRAYGLYLVHAPIVLLLIDAADGFARRAVVATASIALSLLATATLYRYVERPFLAAKSRWEPARRTETAPT